MDQTLQDHDHVPVPLHQDQQYRPYPVPPYLLNSLQDDKDVVMQYRMEITTVSDQSTSLHQQGPNKAVNSRSMISNVVRVCSNCHTTTTPLWRSGPSGPKSLCNACGIRQRKARRAALMAMEAANGGSESTILPINKPKTQVKKPRKNKDQNLPYKKRYKFLAPVNITRKKSTAKSLLFYKEFPKDEADAATLLMGLSCGVLRG